MALPVSIVAMQTITPAKVTPPGIFRRISFAGDLPPATLTAHFRLILYYRSTAGENNTALEIGARMKETFSVALAEEPMFAGRLRRSEAENGRWEVRFNDAGVRLVLAKAAAEMKDVLEAGDREEREWGLVFWRNVERENPDQCALFYIQVTDFQDSSYSIGISCSFLLADPLFLIRFLQKWAPTHRHLSADNRLAAPAFYLSTFKPSPLPPKLTAISAAAPPTSTLLFHHPPTTTTHLKCTSPSPPSTFIFLRSDHSGDVKLQFLENAGDVKLEFLENAGDVKLEFLENAGDVKLEFLENGGGVKVGVLENGGGVKVGVLEEGGEGKAARWEEMGVSGLDLGEENELVGVSCRVVLGGDGAGMVVVMVAGDGSDVLVSVTVPAKTDGNRI